jgi:hypothetical protein
MNALTQYSNKSNVSKTFSTNKTNKFGSLHYITPKQMNKDNSHILYNEYQLSLGNYNPIKSSPNIFIEKLKFRMENYNLELELINDSFTLDHK